MKRRVSRILPRFNRKKIRKIIIFTNKLRSITEASLKPEPYATLNYIVNKNERLNQKPY